MSIALLRPHKTASHALHLALSQGVPDDSICPHPFHALYATHSIRADDYAYHWPHMTPRAFLALPGAGACHIVIPLRAPEARLISAYNFFREVAERVPPERQHSLHRALAHRPFDDSLREDAIVAGQLDNHLSRFLLGQHSQDFDRRAEIPFASPPDATTACAAFDQLLARPRTTFIDLSAGLLAGAPLPRPLSPETGNPNPARRRFISLDTLDPEQSTLLADWTHADRRFYARFVAKARPLSTASAT